MDTRKIKVGILLLAAFASILAGCTRTVKEETKDVTYQIESAIESTTQISQTEIVQETTTFSQTTHPTTESKKTETTRQHTEIVTQRETEFLVKNIRITAEGCAVSSNRIQYVKQVISELPAAFFTYNVEKICFVDNIPKYGKNCHGMSEYRSHTIFLAVNNISNAHIKSVIYHEFAHFADVTYAGYTLYSCYSYEEGWDKPFQSEAVKMNEYYPGLETQPEERRRMETFAMAFDAYYTGCITGVKVNLKEDFPEMYACIEKFMKKGI